MSIYGTLLLHLSLEILLYFYTSKLWKQAKNPIQSNQLKANLTCLFVFLKLTPRDSCFQNLQNGTILSGTEGPCGCQRQQEPVVQVQRYNSRGDSHDRRDPGGRMLRRQIQGEKLSIIQLIWAYRSWLETLVWMEEGKLCKTVEFWYVLCRLRGIF